jgi:hypothetical protein
MQSDGRSFANQIDFALTIAVLLKQIDISAAPQKYFDDTYLTWAVGAR